MTESNASWPYKLEDYPEGYRKYMVAQYGEEYALELLEEWEITPARAPLDGFDTGEGTIVQCRPGERPQQFGLYHVGLGVAELEVHQDGSFSVDSPDDKFEVETRLNWCREMCCGPFYIQSWLRHGEQDFFHDYYVLLSNKRDQMAYELAWKGV